MPTTTKPHLGCGCVVQGSFGNIGFWDGEGVVWPEGPALRGTGERLLQAGLAGLGVPQRHGPGGRAEVGAGLLVLAELGKAITVFGSARTQRHGPVALAEVGGFRAAFACNASGLQAVIGIDGAVFPADAALMDLLARAQASQPWARP